ncbi:MAG: FGGY-family carbohydrate kinase [Bacillota bacterium]|nr:FGGY-family carbohydrate kinase [Bacillota bacterium]
MAKIENYLLGMDCGTTNIKAIILAEDGTVIAEASRPSKFLSPGSNMQEQDANQWWDNTVEIFQTLTLKAGPDIVKRIRGICISSHTVTMLPVDKNGKPLRNAMTYQDNRSSEELHYIVDSIGYQRFVEIVGGQPAVAFLPNKLLWFKKNEPELFAKTACFLQASSYINFKLTGKMTMDIDQASRTQCLDISTMEWSKEIGDVIGIDLDAVLPKPQLVNDIIGFVTEDAAKATGLIAGIPVVAGCSDAMASMHATGMSRLGEAGESSGTTSLVFVGSDVKSAPDIPVVTKPCAIDGMPWVFDAPIQTSGAALKWFIETMAAEEREYAEAHNINIYTYLNELALQSEPGAGGLFFFPYLLGERAPIWNEYARGMFIGMGMNMKRSDLIRSVFEGTAYALRHVMETVKEAGAKASVLRICGGGAKSRTWSQIKASMLKMPVYLLDEKSGDVPVGDALIVGHKVGVFPDLTKAAENIVKVNEIIQPVDKWVEVYDKLYPYYVDMYESLDRDLKSLKNTVDKIY